MPRPKSITREKRVSVFLEYRRTGGKVNPVANRFGIARSTVRVIVNEFIEMGFSQSPRAKVSLDLLKQLQEQHVEELAKGLSVGSDVPGVGVGYLNLGPGTDAEEGRQKAFEQPMPVPEEALWHLRGTKAERVIEEAISAVRDLLTRESEASASLRMAIEEACQQPERDGALDDAGPYLLPALSPNPPKDGV